MVQVRILAGQKKALIPSHSCLAQDQALALIKSCYDATNICSDNLSRASNAAKKIYVWLKLQFTFFTQNIHVENDSLIIPK